MGLAHTVKKSFLFSFVLTISLFLTSCDGGSRNSSSDDSARAMAYVQEIVGIMRENVYTRYEVDWMALENEVYALASEAKNISETRTAILEALKRINTNHSFVRNQDGTYIFYSELNCQQDSQEYSLDDERIGYIRVDGFSGNSPEALEFAESIQNSIRDQDNGMLIGWIVDLRFNGGGNMWPMIAGIGPLLGNGTYGYFVDPDDQITPWGYQNGSSVIDGRERVSVDSPYVLSDPYPKIAVLSSKRLGSSGEATFIAFKKLPNVRTFGTESCGVSTANREFPLSNGSSLYLSVSVMADRELEEYGIPVPVDEPVADEEVYAAAVEWLYNN